MRFLFKRTKTDTCVPLASAPVDPLIANALAANDAAARCAAEERERTGGTRNKRQPLLPSVRQFVKPPAVV